MPPFSFAALAAYGWQLVVTHHADALAYLAGVAFFLAVGRCAQAGGGRIQW